MRSPTSVLCVSLALAAGCSRGPRPAPAPAGPALFMLHDQDTEIFVGEDVPYATFDVPPDDPSVTGPVTPTGRGMLTASQDGRITFDAREADLAEVCDSIGRQVGRNILVDPDVSERVTLALADIAWREAVDVLACVCRLTVEERAGGILVLTREPRLSVRAWELPSRDYFALVAAAAGRNIIVSPEVDDPPVTLHLEGWRWELLLFAHARSLGAEVVQETEDLLRVVPASAIEPRPVDVAPDPWGMGPRGPLAWMDPGAPPREVTLDAGQLNGWHVVGSIDAPWIDAHVHVLGDAAAERDADAHLRGAARDARVALLRVDGRLAGLAFTP